MAKPKKDSLFTQVSILPLPQDAPLLSVDDVAAYLRRTPDSVRKLLNGRRDSDDGELGEVLRRSIVRLSAHRTYIARDPFLKWLYGKAGSAQKGLDSGDTLYHNELRESS